MKIIVFIFLFINMNIYSQITLKSIFKIVVKNDEILTTKQQDIDSIVLSSFDFNSFKPVKNSHNKKKQYKLFYKNGKLFKLSKQIKKRNIFEFELILNSINKDLISAFIYLKSENGNRDFIDGFFIFDLINKKSFFMGTECLSYEQATIFDGLENRVYQEFYISPEINFQDFNVIINVDKDLKSVSRFNLSKGQFISYSEITNNNKGLYERLYICDTRETQSLEKLSISELYKIFDRKMLNSLGVIICDTYPQCINGSFLWLSSSLFYTK